MALVSQEESQLATGPVRSWRRWQAQGEGEEEVEIYVIY